MRRHYETGTKEKVLAYMAECAIRDRAGLIDAYTPRIGEPDEDAKQYIAECKANIRDFKKLAQHGITTPQAQPAAWVGLTDAERQAATGWSVDHIESFLREKNGGKV